MHATGSFTVRLDPQTNAQADPKLGRMTMEKVFQGDLQATSQGQMLSAATGVQGSAGYVAIEKVAGTLGGSSGSFVLQHMGTMHRGVPQLSVRVIPDSGTGELTGLSGSMDIHVADGKHTYEFDYTLAG